MKKTLRFYVSYSFKSKYFALLLAINFAVLFGMFSFIIKNNITANISAMFKYDCLWCWVLIILFYISFLLIQNVKIFNQSEKDGTMLILLTKNIGRLKISLSRLIIIFLNVFIWTLVAFISISLSILFFTDTSSQQLDVLSISKSIEWCLSICVGLIVLGIFASSLIMLMCLFSSPLYACIIVFLFWTIFSVSNIFLTQNRIDRQRILHGNHWPTLIYKNKIKQFKTSSLSMRDAMKKDLDDWTDLTGYETLKYIDIWAQFRSIMHIGFDIKNGNQKSYLNAFLVKKVHALFDNSVKVKQYGHKYYFFPKFIGKNAQLEHNIETKTKIYQNKIDDFFTKGITEKRWVEANKTSRHRNERMDVIQLKNLLLKFAKGKNLYNKNKNIIIQFKGPKSIKITYGTTDWKSEKPSLGEGFYELQAYKYLFDHQNSPRINEIINNNSSNFSGLREENKLYDANGNTDSSLIVMVKKKPYFNESRNLLIWCLITAIMSAISVVIFMQKDIK